MFKCYFLSQGISWGEAAGRSNVFEFLRGLSSYLDHYNVPMSLKCIYFYKSTSPQNVVYVNRLLFIPREYERSRAEAIIIIILTFISLKRLRENFFIKYAGKFCWSISRVRSNKIKSTSNRFLSNTWTVFLLKNIKILHWRYTIFDFNQSLRSTVH